MSLGLAIGLGTIAGIISGWSLCIWRRGAKIMRYSVVDNEGHKAMYGGMLLDGKEKSIHFNSAMDWDAFMGNWATMGGVVPELTVCKMDYHGVTTKKWVLKNAACSGVGRCTCLSNWAHRDNKVAGKCSAGAGFTVTYSEIVEIGAIN